MHHRFLVTFRSAFWSLIKMCYCHSGLSYLVRGILGLHLPILGAWPLHLSITIQFSDWWLCRTPPLRWFSKNEWLYNFNIFHLILYACLIMILTQLVIGFLTVIGYLSWKRPMKSAPRFLKMSFRIPYALKKWLKFAWFLSAWELDNPALFSLSVKLWFAGGCSTDGAI